MVKFTLPNIEDCVINICDAQDNCLCTLDAVDIVNLATESSELSEKQNRDTWEVFQDLMYQKYELEIGNKATCVALYDKANSMLLDIKKKSFQLPNLLDFTEPPQQQ